MNRITYAICPLAITLAWSSPSRADAQLERSQPRAPVDHPHDANAAEEDEHVRFGALAGIGFPHPLSIEGLVEIERVFALGVEYAALPKNSFYGVESSLTSFAGDARVFPFGGPFFVGVRAGRQRFDATTTVSVASLGSASAGLDVETWYVNPRVGFLWTWKPGVSLGVELGVHVPVSSNVSSSFPAAASSIEASANKIADAFGKGVTPTFDLLRVGFLF